LGRRLRARQTSRLQHSDTAVLTCCTSRLWDVDGMERAALVDLPDEPTPDARR
jgi:hypothetical protein